MKILNTIQLSVTLLFCFLSSIVIAQDYDSYLVVNVGANYGLSKKLYGFDIRSQSSHSYWERSFQPGTSVDLGLGFGIFLTENIMTDFNLNLALNTNIEEQNVNGYSTSEGVWFNRVYLGLAGRYLFDISDRFSMGPGLGMNYYMPWDFGYEKNDLKHSVSYQSGFGVHAGVDALLTFGGRFSMLGALHFTTGSLKVDQGYKPTQYTEPYDFKSMDLSAISFRYGIIMGLN